MYKRQNFKLKAKNVAGYRNYDSSEFAATSALLDDDDALEAVWKKQYALTEFTNADQFKSYADLQTRLDSVLNNKQTRVAPEVREEEETVEPVSLETVTAPVGAGAGAGDDDALSYFQKLAEE